MGEYHLVSQVNENLWVIWEYIARKNPEVANRVVNAAYETFQALADQPGLGKPYLPHLPKFRDVRCRKIHGYENYLIFYRESPDGVVIIRVYSRFRNIIRLFPKA